MAKFKSLSDKPGMNAQNTDFTQPGAGLAQAGVNIENLHKKWDALYKDRANKAGGSKQLWENLARWTTTKNAQHFAETQPEQAALFNKSVATGQLQPGLSTKTLSAALDWGIRENDRSQQHKSNFLDSVWGQILGKIAQVGVGFIPGVGQIAQIGLGAALGAAQAAGQTRSSGLDIGLGALSGGVGAYGGGKLATGISSAGGVGNYVGQLYDKAGNFIAHPIDAITGGGVVNNVNALSGAATAARATTSAGALAANAGSGAANAASAGSGFGSLIDKITSNADIIAPLAGAIISSNTAKSAAKTQAAAARDAANSSYATTKAVIDAQEKATAQARKDLQPWRTTGEKALGLQSRLLGLSGTMTPEEVMKLDPGYKFRLGEGARAIDQSAAVTRGPGLSGATLKELTRFGSDYASSEFGKVFDRASNVSGQGLGAATGQANFTQAGATNNANATIAGNNAASDYLTQGANAQAAGTVASGNAWGSAFNNIGQQAYLKQLLEAARERP